MGTEYGKYSTWEQRTEKREGRRAKFREESIQNEVREQSSEKRDLYGGGRPENRVLRSRRKCREWRT